MAAKKFKVGDWVLIPGNFPIKEQRNHWAKVVSCNGNLLELDNLGRLFDCTQDEIGAKRVLNAQERYAIFERDNFRCQICGRSARDGQDIVLEVDHKVAYSAGGTTEDISNLWTLCRTCNHGKGAKSFSGS